MSTGTPRSCRSPSRPRSCCPERARREGLRPCTLHPTPVDTHLCVHWCVYVCVCERERERERERVCVCERERVDGDPPELPLSFSPEVLLPRESERGCASLLAYITCTHSPFPRRVYPPSDGSAESFSGTARCLAMAGLHPSFEGPRGIVPVFMSVFMTGIANCLQSPFVFPRRALPTFPRRERTADALS